MPKKKKPEFPVPTRAEFETMFSGMDMSKKGKKYFKANEDGWSKIFGDVDLVSANSVVNKTDAQGSKKDYLARFLSPMSGVMQIVETGLKAGKRYEVGYKVSTNSDAGFLATTVTYLNENGTPMGVPSSSGVKINSLEANTSTPVSFVTNPAPEGAVKAQLVIVVFGMEQDKNIDIHKVTFKTIS